MKLTVNVPINSLSFGNVSYNILRELWRRNEDISLFPIGDKVQVEAFDKIDSNFINYLQVCANNRLTTFDQNCPSLKLWHIVGSEQRYSKNQALFTFHETSNITPIEKNLLKNQDIVFVTSNYTKNVFESNGLKNVKFVPLGFDEDFHKTNKSYLPNKIHFGILGKLEYRKNTARIIKTWLKLFGNKPEYQLSCAITNPFLDKNKFQNELISMLGGKHYNNINFLPYMNTNSEVNDFLNSIDIDLGGLSGSEGWNIPSFNATCLGKWSVVMNATAHKDWANSENCILVEPSSMKDAHDGTFFTKGGQYNQGQFFDITDEQMEEAILKSVNFAKTPNLNGEKMREQFLYRDTTETILLALESLSSQKKTKSAKTTKQKAQC